LRFVKNYAPAFETVLCESNTLACQLAEQYCGAKIAAWQDLDERNNTFQVVSCIAVFEHIPDSIEFIRRLAKLLVPGGVLYMTMPRLGLLARRISKTALLDTTPPLHLRFFSEKSLRYVESQVQDEIRLRLLRQSHGKTFHVGHLFRPEWYELGDVVPKHEGDVPSRIPVSIPSNATERRAYRLMGVMDKLMAPISEQIDGQRVLHALWQKPA
jgi:SAM-dependent methyltransferase